MKTRSHNGPSLLSLLAAATLLVRPVVAQDNLTNVPDPDPAVQQAALRVAEGFEVNLFATDPMIDPPIAMSWDERGRLWIATSTSYPQPAPGQVANDKIFVLEDTDGDGQADRSTVFADGLQIPTGILYGDGGVYVANSSELLHLRDTDGDGRADARRVVLSGFGVDDTHHLIHTFRWGPDGLFYLNQAVYIYSHVETPWGVERLRGGGIWQFNPANKKLEVFARGLWNPWGYEIDRWGQSFATDGAGFQGIHFMFPDVAYNPAVGAKRVLQGLNPGDPKYSGLALISGRHFADSLAGNLITNDYRANRIKRFVLSEDGSGFDAEQAEDLIWTNHYAFRPVDVNVGPDGALYFADWYNPIIQHGEVDFRDPRRDHRHGRIWRVTAKDRPVVEPPLLHDASVDQLLDALRLPEEWTRRQAKRLLRERGRAVVQPKLDAWVRTLDRAAPATLHDLLEALWTYQAIDVVEAPLVRELLAANDHRARAAAVRVLLHWHERVDGVDALLEDAVHDAHPRVRREALHVLGKRGSADAARHALRVLDYPTDRYIDYALWQAIRSLEHRWLPRFVANPDFLGDDLRAVTFALKSVEAPSAIAHLARRYGDGQVPAEEVVEVLDAIAENGSPSDLDILFQLALDRRDVFANGPAQQLEALERAVAGGGRTPPSGLARVGQFLDDPNDSLRVTAARLVGQWKVTSLREQLQELVDAGEASDEVREAALVGLSAMDDDASRDFLITVAESDRPIQTRAQAARMLARLDLDVAAPTAVALLNAGAGDSEFDAWSIFEAFFAQQDGVAALADALRVQTIPQAVAQNSLDKTSQRGDRFDELNAALMASGATPTKPRMDLDPGYYAFQRLEHDVKAEGNPARGEEIYRRPSLVCTSCHAIGGGGGAVGPDLSSIGVSAPTDYLIESMLKPELAVKDGYARIQISRNDGTLLSGLLVQDAGDYLVVRDAGGADERVPTSQIQRREVIPGSIMPAGLMAQLDRDEFIDLVAFLSALGEEGTFRVPRNKYVRRWRVLRATEEAESLLREGSLRGSVNAPTLAWSPAYSTVAGLLPMEDAPVLGSGGTGMSYVRFELDVTQAGTVTLAINDAAGVEVIGSPSAGWSAGGYQSFDLAAGVHPVTIAIDRAERGEKPVQIELNEDATTARVAFVQGQ